jgi:hypothetical protein
MRRFPFLGMSVLFLPLMILSGCSAKTAASASMASSPFAIDSINHGESYPREDFGPLPSLSSAAIDEAIKKFKISIPKHVARPEIDQDNNDRGRTSWNLFGGSVAVKLGPAAFTSWGLLGATLAHELEIHCQQNLVAITFKDALGLEAKNAAEKEAYAHELSNAERFGLSSEETERIQETLDAINALTANSSIN